MGEEKENARWQEYVTNLQFVDGHPRVGRESLEHGHQELKTSWPVANEQHHADEVEDPHEDAGHVEKLRKRPMRMDDGWMGTLHK